MTLYIVTIQPLRLQAYFCRIGCSYVILISRKGVEISTRPATCEIAGEVELGTPSELNRTQSFQVSFDSPRHRRTVNFSVYDVTNAKNSTKIIGFEIPLSGMCSVLAGDSMCEKKAVSFRIAGKPGRMEVIFRMHPSSMPPPSLGVAYASSDKTTAGDSGKGDAQSSGRMELLPSSAVDALKKAGLITDSSNALEMDAI